MGDVTHASFVFVSDGSQREYGRTLRPHHHHLLRGDLSVPLSEIRLLHTLRLSTLAQRLESLARPFGMHSAAATGVHNGGLGNSSCQMGLEVAFSNKREAYRWVSGGELYYCTGVPQSSSGVS